MKLAFVFLSVFTACLIAVTALVMIISMRNRQKVLKDVRSRKRTITLDSFDGAK